MVKLGAVGRTLTPLMPGGFVLVDGRRLPARVSTGSLDSGQPIIVTGGDNLGLTVRFYDFKAAAEPIKDAGKIVFSSFGEQAKHKGANEHHRSIAQYQRAVRRSYWLGAIVGAVAGLLALWWNVSSNLPDATLSTSPGLQLFLVCSSIWGLLVSRVLFELFEKLGYSDVFGPAAIPIAISIAPASFLITFLHHHHGLMVSLFSVVCLTFSIGGALWGLAIGFECLASSGADSDLIQAENSPIQHTNPVLDSSSNPQMDDQSR